MGDRKTAAVNTGAWKSDSPPLRPGPFRGIHRMNAAPRVWDEPPATGWGYLRCGLTWLRHRHTALSLCEVCCSAQATRKPTVIVGYDEDGIRCRAPGWLLQSGDCTDIVPRERAED